MKTFCVFMLLGQGLLCAEQGATVSDSFCQSYKPIVTKQNVGEIKLLGRQTKQKIVGNDLLYECACKGSKDPICGRSNVAPSSQ